MPVRSIFTSFGQPDEVIQLEEATKPALRQGEIRVQVQAAPINPSDINFIQGVYGIKPELPATPGFEGCGIICESLVDGWEPGDKVIFLQRSGTWSEEVICTAETALKVPHDTPSEQAAMLKVNPLTAWCMLTQFGDLPQGSWVIQNASNSGVGVCVIQIAKLLGLRTINLVRREELIDDLVSQGGDVVLLDNKESFEEIKKQTAPEPPLLALNAVGGDSALRLMDALAPQGTHITYGAMSRRSLKIPNRLLIFKRIQLHGFWLTEWIKEQDRSVVEKAYGQLTHWMMEGSLQQPVDSTFALGDVKAAVERAMQDRRRGKVLITMT